MQLSDFNFVLPTDLIAQEPLQERSASRLLVLNRSEIAHKQVSELAELLQPGDHLVFNNTKVIPARMFGRKQSGGQIELLIERVQSETDVLTKIRASKSPKPGSEVIIAGVRAEVLGRVDDLFQLRFALPANTTLDQFIDEHGQLPLPPYIERQPTAADAERYQTVYANEPGAVAAPTAGLHFDDALLQRLAEAGISHSFVTLHVGAGTFMPVRVNNISEHVMHPERVSVSADTVAAVNAARAAGGRIIAVGTTSVRALESAASDGQLKPYHAETRLFLTPGSRFNAIDAMFTNFHLPESTLLMMVCAFAGYEPAMQAYKVAVKERYRFFSYGDAMLIWP